jgi:hypothetical protein
LEWRGTWGEKIFLFLKSMGSAWKDKMDMWNNEEKRDHKECRILAGGKGSCVCRQWSGGREETGRRGALESDEWET